MKLIIPILLIIFGISVGVFIYVRLSDQSLVERSINLEGNEISMLVPKNLEYEEKIKDGELVVGFGRQGQNISVVGVYIFKSTSDQGKDVIESADCSTFKLKEVLSVNVKSLNKTVNVCTSPSGEEAYLTSNIIDSKNIYVVGLFVKNDYLETAEGKTKVKEIIASFTVNN